MHEDPPKFDEVEEILKPKIILRHEDNLLSSDKLLCKYLVKFKNYSFDDVQWMMESLLKDCVLLVENYKNTHGLDDENNKDVDV